MIVLDRTRLTACSPSFIMPFSTEETHMTIRNHKAYTAILCEEIQPASGCREPISIAYCAAKAHQVLAMQPTAVTVSVSDSILKSVRSIVVPNTNGLKGIRAAVATGIVCGNADNGMQVIANINTEQHDIIARFLETVPIDVSCAETDCPIYISVTLYARTSYSRVVIANNYSNIVEIMKNGEALLKRPIVMQREDPLTDKSCLNLHDIYEYAVNIDINEVRSLLDMQISYNMAICEEGLRSNYGANVGKIMLSESNGSAKAIARAYAAAGSDARMSGCEMSVASLCGSGNQGIAASVPVLCYARHYAISKERTYRALVLSDLLTVYQNTRTERSSAYCGVICAGCAAGAAIAYLLGEDESAVFRTFSNSTAMNAETVCDGATPSCAVKIASAIDAGILGYQLYLYQQQLRREKGHDFP